MSEAKPGRPETAVEEFGNIVAVVTRFINRLGRVPLFSGDLGMAEWVALSVLNNAGEISNKRLSIRLGVTRQRAHQLVNQLAKADLIVVEISPIDARENVLRLTAKGKKSLKALNQEVDSVLSAALGQRIARLPKIQKDVSLLLRVVRTARFRGEQNAGERRGKQADGDFRPLDKSFHAASKHGAELAK